MCALSWLHRLPRSQPQLSVCIVQWRLVTGVRLAACKHRAGGSSPQHAHCGRGQLWGSRLAASETGTGCQGSSWTPTGTRRDPGSWCQLLKIPLGQNLVKSSAAMSAVLAMGFLSGEICWVCLQVNGSPFTTITPTVCLLLVALLFSLVPSCLYVSALLLWVK